MNCRATRLLPSRIAVISWRSTFRRSGALPRRPSAPASPPGFTKPGPPSPRGLFDEPGEGRRIAADALQEDLVPLLRGRHPHPEPAYRRLPFLGADLLPEPSCSARSASRSSGANPPCCSLSCLSRRCILVAANRVLLAANFSRSSICPTRDLLTKRQPRLIDPPRVHSLPGPAACPPWNPRITSNT